ncbi:hypothetical protein HanIR_Chr15g0733201 [Helianthus annuus]|nr:hypothetical protein HanIR_Chr15g0733201 [Helianthus annuus]
MTHVLTKSVSQTISIITNQTLKLKEIKKQIPFIINIIIINQELKLTLCTLSTVGNNNPPPPVMFRGFNHHFLDDLIWGFNQDFAGD